MKWPLMIRRVHGHSMVPALPPDTLVVAWCWKLRIRPGSIVIFVREGRETIKRVERVGPEGVFVVGDHAEASTDSRHFGPISVQTVVGLVIWPRP
jgi:nickel-type superoxide dismutase maturation protease